MAITQLTHCEPRSSRAWGHYANQRHQFQAHRSSDQSQPAVDSAATIRAKSQTNLTVLTAEGDQITISLAARAKIAAASQDSANGGSQAVATSTSSRLSVLVKGDLSDDELADLKTLLGALGSADNQAQQTGSLDPAELSKSLEGLDSLAAFDYSHKQNVQVGILVNAVG